jgi:hypothetical protein
MGERALHDGKAAWAAETAVFTSSTEASDTEKFVRVCYREEWGI